MIISKVIGLCKLLMVMVILKMQNLSVLLKDYFSTTDTISYVFSPYINKDICFSILNSRFHKSTIIITSWAEKNILMGSSSLDLYKLTKRMNWHLFINNNLHLKLYSDSLQSAWIGSANLTRRGLLDGNNTNIEGLYFIDKLNMEERLNLKKLINESVHVNDKLYEIYKSWLDKQQKINHIVIDELYIPPDIKEMNYFLTSQLPASKSPSKLWALANNIEGGNTEENKALEHDIILYNILPNKNKDSFLKELNISFFSHPFIRAFINQISEEGLFFGAASKWLHDKCTTVPTPYRKDIKEHVSIIFQWCNELAPDEYVLSRPHHSQMIQRIPIDRNGK